MLNKYAYLFPYNKVPSDCRIVIYGAGDVGQEYLKQIYQLNYCTVVGVLDRDYERYSFLKVPVYPPNILKDLIFDYIVIALKTDKYVAELRENFIRQGVPKNRVVYNGVHEQKINITKEYDLVRKKGGWGLKNKITMAYNLYRCGYGDAIIAKKYLDQMLGLCPSLLVDIYSTGKTSDYLPYIYGQNERVNILSPKNTTYNYEDVKDEYMLSIQWYNFLRIDTFVKEDVERIDGMFAKTIEALMAATIKYMNLSLYELMARARYEGRNVYTMLYYQDVLGINDMYVELPDGYYDKKESDRKNKYITFDLSDEDGQRKAGKLWPRSYMEKFVRMFQEEYSDIDIVQLGSADVPEVLGVKHCLGLDFSRVMSILKNSLLHIGPEGGTVHLASQLRTKCIVLFGCTPIWYYGYPHNINITAGVCEPCYCLLGNNFYCAKSLVNPECMYAITPEMVMEKVREII